IPRYNIVGRRERHPVFAAKSQRPFADRQYMARLLHHAASGLYGIAWPNDTGNRSRPAAFAVHHGIERAATPPENVPPSPPAPPRGRNGGASRRGPAQALVV